MTQSRVFRLPEISSSVDASRALETARNREIRNTRERQTTARLSVPFNATRFKGIICTSPTLLGDTQCREYYHRFNNDITSCTGIDKTSPRDGYSIVVCINFHIEMDIN